MKLALMTWDIAKKFPLAELIRIAKAFGIGAFEFRAQSAHAHGVEVERTPEEREAIRGELAAAGLATAGVATGNDLSAADPAERRKLVEDSKNHVRLAADLGGTHIRLFANKLPEGRAPEEVVDYVARALREIAEAAQGTGVDVLLEMHGKFREPELAVGAVKAARHPGVGIIFNSNHQDTIEGSVKKNFAAAQPWLRHVHVHDFEKKAIPYAELFALLKKMKFQRYVSLEMNDSPDQERVIGLQALLYHEMLKNA